MLEPPFDDCLIAQLQEVSNEWLDGRNEMNFSVGQFKHDYLNKAPIGVIRNDSEIIGFISYMPTYYNNSFSVDMIRWKDNELQMMDGLYLNTMLLMKEKGYHSFNMGMAPLSNVGSHKHAFYRERLAGKIFDSISRLYSFKGLRRYKEKFDPDWQSRYLVYRKDSSLITQMIRINSIINRSKNLSVSSDFFVSLCNFHDQFVPACNVQGFFYRNPDVHLLLNRTLQRDELQ